MPPLRNVRAAPRPGLLARFSSAGGRSGFQAERAGQRGLVLAALALLLAAAVVLSLGAGAARVPAGRVVLALLGQPVEARDAAVVLRLRLPRVVLGMLVGAGLGVAGAALQGLFRNPLADPGLIGVSSGAALGAVGSVVLGVALAPLWPVLADHRLMPLAAFATGLGAVALVRLLARDGGTGALLLAGIAVNALASAATGLMIYLSDDSQLRTILFWTLGSLAAGGWGGVAACAPFVLLALLLLLGQARPLNALLLGDRDAFHLGVNVRRTRRIVVTAAALAVGAGVAVSGVIGFVGLVVPHLLRLAGGPDHRLVLPGAALLGATLLLLADCVARTALIPAELPVGLLTSAVGGPFFVWLLARNRSVG